MASLVTALALTFGLASAAAEADVEAVVARLPPPPPLLAPATSARTLASKLLSDDPEVCMEEWEWSTPALPDEAPYRGTELPSVPMLLFIMSWAAFNEDSDERLTLPLFPDPSPTCT